MKKEKPEKSTSLIIRSVSLSADKMILIQLPTPKEFIKVRPGKKGKSFRYVEGGYVIARLNQIFSPIGWDFDIVHQEVTPAEVIVRGRLEIKDFKTGFSIGKTRTGTKERVAGIPLGDSIKAAETDALKKCASHFGIGLDVYWQQLDEDKFTAEDSKSASDTDSSSMTDKKKGLLKMSMEKIRKENDPTVLAQYRERIEQSDLYTEDEKKTLYSIIAGQFKKNAGNNT